MEEVGEANIVLIIEEAKEAFILQITEVQLLIGSMYRIIAPLFFQHQASLPFAKSATNKATMQKFAQNMPSMADAAPNVAEQHDSPTRQPPPDFAVLAQETDPMLDGPNQFSAIVDVHITPRSTSTTTTTITSYSFL
ncbi:hypothetical protein RHSIM_Rhsim02G0132900 [Rhododendron simsii]|uniref:Uncharacterized protein n=1 Tax=Rhododendron simsii TaxID=118357 RepID=A0A834LWA7_RHOSS|nr:hypothetical protein RHSIM_Rhsim02G0132900 [Rhododendron simsii]